MKSSMNWAVRTGQTFYDIGSTMDWKLVNALRSVAALDALQPNSGAHFVMLSD